MANRLRTQDFQKQDDPVEQKWVCLVDENGVPSFVPYDESPDDCSGAFGLVTYAKGIRIHFADREGHHAVTLERE